MYLLDYDKLDTRVTPPEDHLLANTILSGLTGIVSLALAIILYTVFLGREDTPVIMYVVAGFLVAMFAWQVQTFWRKLVLKKHLPKKENGSMESVRADEKEKITEPSAKMGTELSAADFENAVPPTVTESTTKKLKVNVRNSTETQKQSDGAV